MKPLFEPGTHP